MFNGTDEPVSGDTRTQTTAVLRLDDRTNEIISKRDGRVTGVIMNVLSEDHGRIDNTYLSYDEKGHITRKSTAVYERMK